MTNYFDDFVSLSKDSERSAVTSCIQMYFKLLGWAFSESGDKAPPFGAMFQALGGQYRCVDTAQWKLGNTESRRKELIDILDLVIA